MNMPDLLKLPDDFMVPIARVREAFGQTVTDHPDRLYSTEEAAETFGKSEHWWREACRASQVPGAFQLGPRTPWSLPLHGIRSHLDRLQSKPRDRSKRRGPYLKRKEAA